MPKLLPPGGDVNWPINEGAIGVVGFSPWSALNFCRLLWSFVPVRKEWEYPRVISDFNTKIPSRGRHLELNETDPSPAIRQTITELAVAGATVAAVPCNTAHLLFERWGNDAPIPIAHIGHCTAIWAKIKRPDRICVLSSFSIWNSGRYQRWMEEVGVSVEPTLSEEARQAVDIITHVKYANMEAAGTIFTALGEALQRRGIEGIVLGCTELALAASSSDAALPCLDSNQALALETLRMANVRIPLPDSLWKTFSGKNSIP